MAKRNGKKNGNGNGGGGNGNGSRSGGSDARLHPETKKSIWAIGFICAAAILILAGFNSAGPAGDSIFSGLYKLFGWGYFILPATLLFAAAVFLFSHDRRLVGVTMMGAGLLILS